MQELQFESQEFQAGSARKRALTASTYCPPQSFMSQAMELEHSEDLVHVLSFQQSKLTFLSPAPSTLNKRDLHSYQLDDTFQSINRYHASARKKPKTEVEADIFFDFTLQKSQSMRLQGFLESHDITEKYRAKMMDWMIEVLNLSKQKEETVLRAFYIMDLFFAKSKTRIPVDQLHKIGSVAMLIASKQEEVSPVTLDALLKTVCRDKFTKEEILIAEFQILSTIEFRVSFPTIFELSRCAFSLLQIDDEEVRQFFQKGSLLIAKMCLFSYEILNQFTYAEITALSLILSLKLVENFRRGFESKDKVS
jgi:hypothetical protein